MHGQKNTNNQKLGPTPTQIIYCMNFIKLIGRINTQVVTRTTSQLRDETLCPLGSPFVLGLTLKYSWIHHHHHCRCRHRRRRHHDLLKRMTL